MKWYALFVETGREMLIQKGFGISLMNQFVMQLYLNRLIHGIHYKYNPSIYTIHLYSFFYTFIFISLNLCI